MRKIPNMLSELTCACPQAAKAAGDKAQADNGGQIPPRSGFPRRIPSTARLSDLALSPAEHQSATSSLRQHPAAAQKEQAAPPSLSGHPQGAVTPPRQLPGAGHLQHAPQQASLSGHPSGQFEIQCDHAVPARRHRNNAACLFSRHHCWYLKAAMSRPIHYAARWVLLLQQQLG